MSSGGHAEIPAGPKLPWYATYVLLGLIVLVTLIKPFAPNGFREYFWRLTSLPISLSIGHGAYLQFSEHNQIGSSCRQAVDVAWSADSSVIIVNCTTSLQAWTRDGRQLGTALTKELFAPHEFLVLENPLRVVYRGHTDKDTAGLTTWNVRTGELSFQPESLLFSFDFAVDRDQRLAAAVGVRRVLTILSADDWRVVRTIPLPTVAFSVAWLPSMPSVLIGSYDGTLPHVDVASADVTEMRLPDAARFQTGSILVGVVKGRCIDNDGKTVALYFEGEERPDSHTTNGGIDSVEIRPLADGQLIARMPGPDELGVSSMARDPRDRFVAVVGHNSLILWSWQAQSQAVMTLSHPGIHHGMSISPDGTMLALTSLHGVRLFRIKERDPT